MTKAPVAMLVGMLVDEEKLAWDTAIRTILPEFHSVSEEVTRNATILDLLCHRIGITALDALWLESDNTILIEKNQAIECFGYLSSEIPFRSGFIYNNMAYGIISLVITKVTGRSLSDLLEEGILTPLGMTRSSTSWNTVDDNVAKSYQTLEDMSPCEVTPPMMGDGSVVEAAGSIKSTVHDLLILYKAFMSAANSQFETHTNSTKGSIFKQCRMLLSMHTILPGFPFASKAMQPVGGEPNCQANLVDSLGILFQVTNLFQTTSRSRYSRARTLVLT